ncbi:ATP-binding protein [Brevibacillus laterosporus]|uniref:ATP-binding protein n=1 Tax=Brevibacillus laterosporus TaxID=1465 RepID=UPI00264BBF12|nr:ATP-binding protein [Brevibacillus laterosporus]MDN9010710.1 ATP-binding protein [Brevibacillus laterosporus]MDO0941727.1 ATP-binding protein [Brevibacillus laterosporus]
MNNTKQTLVPETAPYKTCGTCVVEQWCKRRDGSMALPKDYQYNCECNGYVMLEQAIKLSKIPLEYQRANLRSFKVDVDNEAHYPRIRYILSDPVEFVKSGMNVTLFHNNKGTGKTFTACAIANEYIYKTCLNPALFDFENPIALYVKFGDWSNEIRHAHQVGDSVLFEQMYNNIKQMKNVPLLIMDDIGSGRITDVIRDLTYDVIDKRKEELRSTIFTSNYVDSILKQDSHLGEVIVSRLMYNAVHIGLGGRDRRTA